MAGRPKRKAAIKATQIIEISDSDDDVQITTRRGRDSSFSPPPTKSARIDAAARSLTGREVATTSTAARFIFTKQFYLVIIISLRRLFYL